ncbi:DUF4265 domain-containing protein [Micromonospora sp. NPDC023644]|uniref:DUF4265 domain-containing protein n=1 Tax=Micromonospora sp. NPDC023644 TaxID=3154321 RepID=UPI0033E622B6
MQLPDASTRPVAQRSPSGPTAGPHTARICNVPFLQDGVAEGDVVRFTTPHRPSLS